MSPNMTFTSVCKAKNETEKVAATTAHDQPDQMEFPGGLKAELMPKHVAMILDGNRRWARERGMAPRLGHQIIPIKLKEIANLSNYYGINVLTVFVFSTENWNRSQEEVDFLMQLFENMLKVDLEEYNRKGTRISVIGEKSNLPKTLQDAIIVAEDTTKDNTKLHLMIAMNYGGRQDIIQATKRIVKKVNDGIITNENIDEKLFSDELLTNCTVFPNPDLLIRTSGEQRLSNFLMWQLSYSEFFFAAKNFPEFEEDDFIDALMSFQARQRRFGGK